MSPRSYRIGRHPDNEIVLNDPLISQFHARLTYQNQSFGIFDLGSKNGTLINNEIILNQALQNGDQIQIGRDIFTFYQELPAAVASYHPKDQTISRIFKGLTAINQTFQSSRAVEDILGQIIDAVLEITQCQRGFLILYNTAHQPEFTISRNFDLNNQAEVNSQLSTTAVNQVLARGEMVIVENTPTDSQFNAQASVIQLRLMSLICLPLFAVSPQQDPPPFGYPLRDQTLLGVIYADTRIGMRNLTTTSTELLQILAHQAALAIENALLFRASAGKKELDLELAAANRIQQNLLPMVNYDALDFAIGGLNFPCAQIGGDYYDYFPFNNNQFGVIIADVCGKGIPAALLMSGLQAALKSQLKYIGSIEELVQNLNYSTIGNAPQNRFITAFIGVYDPPTRGFNYINCGHNPALWRQSGGAIQTLKSSGIPLGIMPDLHFTVNRIQLEPGDWLVLYTDGVTEAQNQQHENFGIERLKHVCLTFDANSVTESKPAALLNRIVQQVQTHLGGQKVQDDLTLLVFQMKLPTASQSKK
ncbi:SpoIIE family protein phosphatase [candidate division KSB1 bacterium]|nr:SpoIIE family protein phosphatase [candidate division KSB1 bacterium]